MQIEVPSDKYEAAISAMKDRIRKGEVPGVINPEDASDIVRKGHFTYEQVRNIAKAGTVESILYDSANGAIIATSTLGITAILSFATAVWNGESTDDALKKAASEGIKVGGTNFVTAVLSGQLSKAGLNSFLVGSSESVVKVIGPKSSATLVNAFRHGNNIYGAAAMKSASKMLRTNAITGAVSVAVSSSGDIVNLFRKRISGKKLFKNLVNTSSSVAGGMGGWIAGASVGSAIGSVIPGVGTVVGGTVGGLIGAFGGGSVAGKISESVTGAFLEDDAEEMVKIIEKILVELASEYLLTEKEAENVIEGLGKSLTGKCLKDMFAAPNREEYAKQLILPHIESNVSKRKKVRMPDKKTIAKGINMLFKEMEKKIKRSEDE